MAIKLVGNSSNPIDISGTTYRSMKVQQMPLDYGSLGSYKVCMTTGTIAAGIVSGAEILQFRWTNATNLAVIQRLVINDVTSLGTGFTAGFGNIGMYTARSFSVSGSGGTAITGAQVPKMRTSMATSAVGDLRYASTGALTAGTETLDADPIAQTTFTVSAAPLTNIVFNLTLFGHDTNDGFPLILAQNEGFVLKTTMPATGTWQASFALTWTEVPSY